MTWTKACSHRDLSPFLRFFELKLNMKQQKLVT